MQETRRGSLLWGKGQERRESLVGVALGPTQEEGDAVQVEHLNTIVSQEERGRGLMMLRSFRRSTAACRLPFGLHDGIHLFCVALPTPKIIRAGTQQNVGMRPACTGSSIFPRSWAHIWDLSPFPPLHAQHSTGRVAAKISLPHSLTKKWPPLLAIMKHRTMCL